MSQSDRAVSMADPAEFQWLDPGDLFDETVRLVLAAKNPANLVTGFAPAYRFDIRLINAIGRLGRIELRIGETYDLRMFSGHIGYGIDPVHRGHRYAARACKLILPLAIRHGMKTLWITCNPDNIASRRTCELVGAVFVEIVDLPEDNEMYRRGERQKCRYRIDL